MIMFCGVCGIVVSAGSFKVMLKSFGSAMIMISLFTLATIIYTSVQFSLCTDNKTGVCATSTGDRVGLFYIPSIILVVAAMIAGVLGCILFTKIESDDGPKTSNYY
eukprot:TRINITY_DN2746_c0_g1_i1.p1 TRINITY_DN2746_c0_g1~~TRINITY_DN2746_c0_g1_i1.p1  ORF type:complete len:106 (-),score=37.97 TRINITY_DN2746_c0_g1_i1:47-364(-)